MLRSTRRRPTLLDLESLDGSGVRRSRLAVVPRCDLLEARVAPAFFTTTTTLASTANPAAVGQPVMLTTKVTAQGFFGSFAPPSGAAVRFFVDGAEVGSARTDAAGVAAVTLSTLAAGSHAVRASFPGGFMFDTYAASERSLTQTVESVAAPAPPAVPPPPPPIVPQQRIVTGTDPGDGPVVRSFRTDGTLAREVMAFDPGFRGGVRVGAGDVTGDGVPDVFASPGPGGGPWVRAFDGETGAVLWEKLAFEGSFTGGLFVAVGDVTGDGVPDVVVTPDQGGGPVVKTFQGRDGAEAGAFLGIDDPNFRGGCRVSLGDVNGDARFDVLVSAGFGGGPRAVVYDGTGVTGLAPGSVPARLVDDFFAFEDGLRNGAYVGMGDLTGDGYAELVFGGGPGGGPRVLVLDGMQMVRSQKQSDAVIASFFAGEEGQRNGVRVSITDVNDDGTADILTSAPGAGAKAYNGRDRQPLTVSDVMAQALAGGGPVTGPPLRPTGGSQGLIVRAGLLGSGAGDILGGVDAGSGGADTGGNTGGTSAVLGRWTGTARVTLTRGGNTSVTLVITFTGPKPNTYDMRRYFADISVVGLPGGDVNLSRGNATIQSDGNFYFDSGQYEPGTGTRLPSRVEGSGTINQALDRITVKSLGILTPNTNTLLTTPAFIMTKT